MASTIPKPLAWWGLPEPEKSKMLRFIARMSRKPIKRYGLLYMLRYGECYEFRLMEHYRAKLLQMRAARAAATAPAAAGEKHE